MSSHPLVAFHLPSVICDREEFQLICSYRFVPIHCAHLCNATQFPVHMSHQFRLQTPAVPAVLSQLCCPCRAAPAVLLLLCCSCCAVPVLLLCYYCCAAPAVLPLYCPCCVALAVLPLLCCSCTAPAVRPLPCCPCLAAPVATLVQSLY